MQPVDDGWSRVATWLEREMAVQGTTLRAMELKSGVNFRTLQKLLDGQPVRRRDVLARLSNALGYEGDAVLRVHDGGQPTRTGEDVDDVPDLEHRVNRVEERLDQLNERLDGLVEAIEERRERAE